MILLKVFPYLPTLKLWALNKMRQFHSFLGVDAECVSKSVFSYHGEGHAFRAWTLLRKHLLPLATLSKALCFCKTVVPIVMGTRHFLLISTLAFGILHPVPENPENYNSTPANNLGDIASVHWQRVSLGNSVLFRVISGGQRMLCSLDRWHAQAAINADALSSAGPEVC